MSTNSIKNANILIVDDHPSNLGILFEYLNRSGYRVLIAEDGEGAYDLINKEPVDLILLDIMMPGISGFDICKTLKNQEDTKEIPILFISGLSETFDKVKAFELGGVDYITKPFQKEEVLARVNAHLTIRKQQIEIRKSEQQFRSVWENSFDGMRLIDENGIITLVNQAYCDMVGKKREELEGASFETVYTILPEDTKFDTFRENIKKKDVPNEQEEEILLWNGKKSWFSISNSFIEPENEPYKLLSIFRDITANVWAEEALRVSEERFKTVADFTYDWEYWMGPDEQLIWISPSCKRTTGYDVEEFEIEPELLRKIVHPDDLEIYDNHINNRDNVDGSCTIDFKILTRDGQEKWIAHNCQPVFSDNNEPRGYRASNRDITERKHFEEALAEQEEKYRLLSELTSDYAYSFEITKERKFVNEWLTGAFEKITGYSKKEFTQSMELTSMVIPGDKPLVKNHIEKVMGGMADVIEYRIFTKNGDIRWLRDYARPVMTDDGQSVEKIYGAAQDITERRVAEDKLKTYMEELQMNQDLLEERAGQLVVLNSQLEESRRELKILNDGKDKLFSIVAHDLRSPFTSLLGYAQFLSEDIGELETDKIQEFAGNIHRSLKDIYHLIENLLKWSRVQAGRITFSPDTFDLNELINNILDLYTITATRKEIQIQNKLSSKLMIFADKFMVDTIIRNLVSNAIKYTNQGGRVEIDTKTEESFALVSVKDTGIGMNEEQMLQVYDLDKKIVTKGTMKEPGTGLGLILCKEFIERHGGKIWINSEENKGSEFIFTLPLTKEKIPNLEN